MRRVEVLVDLVRDFAVICFEDGVFEEEAKRRHFGYQDALVSVQLVDDAGGGTCAAGEDQSSHHLTLVIVEHLLMVAYNRKTYYLWIDEYPWTLTDSSN